MAISHTNVNIFLVLSEETVGSKFFIYLFVISTLDIVKISCQPQNARFVLGLCYTFVVVIRERHCFIFRLMIPSPFKVRTCLASSSQPFTNTHYRYLAAHPFVRADELELSLNHPQDKLLYYYVHALGPLL